MINHQPSRFIQNIYAQHPGVAFAFCDEAYRGFEREGERPFYVFTAVVVAPDDQNVVRADLVDMVGSSYWHTSEALRTPDGRAIAKEMITYLADGQEPCVVAVETVVEAQDTDLEQARSACLSSVIRTLVSGDICDPVPVVVIERRNTSQLVAADQKTHKALITDGHVPRNHRLVQASPSDDNLLWLPDVVCSAVRRHHAFGDDDQYGLIADRIHFVETRP